MKGSPGRVISVDVDRDSNAISFHEKIDFVLGDSGSAATAQRIAAMLPRERGRLFMILDSDHTREHVLRELESLVPLLRGDDYLVVEERVSTVIRCGRTSARDRSRRCRNISRGIPGC